MICLFGGTFDPIHLGHIIISNDIKDELNIDKVIFIPSFISPFKKEGSFAPPEHRIEMIKISIKENDFFDVSNYEVKKGKISHTIDTIRYFKKIYNEIAFLIGWDNVKEFKKWKEWEEILRNSHIIVARRKDFEDELLEGMKPVKTRIIEISSTEIRNRIKEGKEIGHLVKDGVKDYIYRNKLYFSP